VFLLKFGRNFVLYICKWNYIGQRVTELHFPTPTPEHGYKKCSASLCHTLCCWKLYYIWNICLICLKWNIFISAMVCNSHEMSVTVFLLTRLALTNKQSWHFEVNTTEIASNHQRAQTTWNAPLFDFVILPPVPSSHLSYI